MKNMYNAELKQRFIEERTAEVIVSNGYFKLWFNKTASFEEVYDKDLSNFTYYEIVDMYKNFNVNSVGVLQVLNSHLSAYTQWCLQQNLVVDSQNHFLEVKLDAFKECINSVIAKKKVVSREQVLDWAMQLRNPSDSFIFLAIFEGIRGKLYDELAFLKISDFHDGKVKLSSGREIEVSNELYNLALEANSTLEYYSVVGDTITQLQNDDLIIKNYMNVLHADDLERASQRILKRINRNVKYLGLESFLNGTALYESGKIDYIKRRSKQLGISCHEYLSTKKSEVEARYACTIPRENVYYNKYKEYLE